MIKSFKNARTQQAYETGNPQKFRGLDGAKMGRRFDLLEAASRLDDLPRLKSIGLHHLQGDRAGQWAMTVNGPWRLVFTPTEDGWADVELADYHKG